MTTLYNLTCDLPSAPLQEMEDGSFALMQAGPCAPLMAGPRYLLVEHALAACLERAGVPGLSYEPVLLRDAFSGQASRTHTRIRVAQSVPEHQILTLSFDGPQLIAANDHHYFVSPELKALLEQEGFAYLSFTEGLNNFAGLGVTA